jgi:Tfp pilus assembly protein PilF
MTKRKINPKAVVEDIRAGMRDSALREKYALSSKGLQNLLSKLAASGLIEQSEIDGRAALEGGQKVPTIGSPSSVKPSSKDSSKADGKTRTQSIKEPTSPAETFGTSKERPTASLAQAGHIFGTGNIDLARSMVEQILRDNPEEAAAHKLLALIRHRTGHFENAASEALRAAELEPNSADFQFTAGWALHESGKLTESELHYLEALRLDPTHASAWYNLGNVMRSLGRDTEAVAAYERCLEVRPNHFLAKRNLEIVQRNLARSNRSEGHKQE